jgi:hypothetical protein
MSEKVRRIVQTNLKEYVEEYGVDKWDELDDSVESVRCKCKYCLDAGESSMKVSMTVFFNTLSFYCYRCKTLGFDSSIKLGSSEYKLSRLQKSVNSRTNSVLKNIEFNPIDIDHLSPIRSNDYLNYFITKRSYKYVPYLDQWDFREIEFLGRKGIMLPFTYDGLVINYQIRYLKDGKMKYYTNSGSSLKIPYFLNGFNSNNDYSTITIVEGIFDATAASLFNFPNPVAVLGSTLTDLECNILFNICKPTTIILAFDDMSLNNKMKKLIESKYLCTIKYIDTNGSDLDEYLKLGKEAPLLNDYSNIQLDNRFLEMRDKWKKMNH